MRPTELEWRPGSPPLPRELGASVVASLLMVLGAFWTWFNDQFLAVVTLALVAVTAQVAAQTRASVRAAVQPLLADVPPSAESVTIDYTFGQSGSGDGLAVEVQERGLFHVDVRQDYYGTYFGVRSVALRNIGNGPALIERVELTVDGKDPASSPAECWRSPRIVPREETVRLMARVRLEPEFFDPDPDAFAVSLIEPFKMRPFVITAEYTDVGGDQRHRVSVPVYLWGGAHGGHGLRQGDVLIRRERWTEARGRQAHRVGAWLRRKGRAR